MLHGYTEKYRVGKLDLLSTYLKGVEGRREDFLSRSMQ